MGTTRQKSSCRNGLQNGPRLLLRVKAGTHSPSPTGSHTAAYTPKQGPSGQGRYHYPRRVPHVHEHPRAGCQNGKLCRFWALVGCAPEERRKPTGQRCAYARRCPVGVAAPLGCVICLQLGDVAVFSLCAQYFLNVRGGGGITTLGAFHTVRKPCVAGYQNGVLCRFWVLPGVRSRRTQRAFGTAMRLCVSLFRGVAAPLGCVIFFRFCRNLWLYAPHSGLSMRARWGWYHYPRRALRTAEVLGARLSKRLICRFLRSDGRRSLYGIFSDISARKIRL